MSEPTATQEKAWLNRITRYAEEHGAFPKGDTYGFDRHHVVGRTRKENKVHIGKWFVLPIMSDFHDVNSNNEFNVTHWRRRYGIEFGWQTDQFSAMCAVIKSEDGSLPFSLEVYHAIQSTRY